MTRVRPVFRWMLGVTLVGITLYVAWTAWDYIEARRLNAAIVEVRARGIVPELTLGPPPQEYADDVARLYEAAATLIPNDATRWGFNPRWNAIRNLDSPFAPHDLVKARAILAESETAFDLVRRAETAPVRKWRLPFGRSTASLLHLLNLLSFRTTVLGRTGAVDEAAGSVIQESNMRRWFEGVESPPWSFPVATMSAESGIAHRAAGDLEFVLNAGRVSSEMLDRLADTFAHEVSDDAAKYNRWHLGAILNSGGFQPEFVELRMLPIVGPAMRPLMRRYGRLSILADADIIEAANTGWPENVRRLKAFAARSTEQQAVSGRAVRRSAPWSMGMGAMVSIQYGSAAESAAGLGRSLAMARCARVVVAVERARRASGRLPERLEVLVPAYLDAVPLDPFTGTSLLYRQDAHGFTVYSVGEDMTDDGGVLIGHASLKVVGDKMPPFDVGIRINNR